jgi:hypothetical protein
MAVIALPACLPAKRMVTLRYSSLIGVDMRSEVVASMKVPTADAADRTILGG